MGNPYKIKSHKRIYRRSLGSILLQCLLILAAVAVLFGAGWALYEPVSHWLSGEEVLSTDELETQLPEQEPAPEPEPIPELEPAPEPTPEPEIIPEPAPEPTPESEPEEPAWTAEQMMELLTLDWKQWPTVLGNVSLKPGESVTFTARKTAYISQETLLDIEAFAKALEQAKADGMDSVLVELKSSTGWVSYPIAYKEGFDDYYALSDGILLDEIAEQIRQAGMIPMAAIHTFQDRRFQQSETYAGVLYKGSESFWLDNAPQSGGKAWLNPYSQFALDYIAKIMDDAASAGFGQIVLQSFQFPVGYSMDQMNFVYDGGKSKQQCLKDDAQFFRQKAAELGAELWLQLPASPMVGGDVRAYDGDCSYLMDGDTVVDFSSNQLNGQSLSDAVQTVKGKAAGQLRPMGEREQRAQFEEIGFTDYILGY